MRGIETVSVRCPTCWETIEVVVDASVPHQRYVEDCSVCCRPMVVEVVADGEGPPSVTVRGEDD